MHWNKKMLVLNSIKQHLGGLGGYYVTFPFCFVNIIFTKSFLVLSQSSLTFFHLQEPFNLQLKVFMNEVSQQSLIPVIRR